MEKYGFGVDVGGTGCKFGLFREDGTLLEKWEIPTNKNNKGEDILEEVAVEIEHKVAKYNLSPEKLLGVGVGVPGPVNSDGVVDGCVNLGWQKKNVVEELETRLKMRIKVANDANVAALGELYYGCGKGYDSLVMITLGTGVGGGIIIDKKILCGAMGAAGEIGHLVVNERETEFCACGRKGCLEQYVSATGIQKMAKKLLTKEERKTILNIDTVDAKSVFEAAMTGDCVAQAVVEEVASILGKALGNIGVVLNPQLFALGGGVSNAGSYLSEKIERELRKHAFHACKDTPVVIAKLGNDAGIYGCMGMLN